jgi:type III secretory pathway component EscU
MVFIIFDCCHWDMGVRDLSQIVAIISYCATVVESSSSQWESYTVVSAYTLFGILDLAREILSSYKEKILENSWRRHIYRDISGLKATISICDSSFLIYPQPRVEPVLFQSF